MLAYDISSKKLKVAAVFFSSFLFAGAHFRDILENYFIGFPLFLLGLYFAFWTLRKKGIMMPVVMHMTQNFLASIAMLYGKQV
jgi:membrane protease YdiL (CAAX protease family)